MKTVTATLTGVSPYSQNKAILSTKETGEGHDVFERRVWKERMHVDHKGEVFIPPMAIKLMLSECAKFLSETVPGKGKATYTKHFEAGIMVVMPGCLGIKADNVDGEWVHVPTDGKRGGGSRVWKCFPVMPKWEIITEIQVFDPILTGHIEKVEEYLNHAGKFIGLGRFRPRNNGYYGRFEVSNFMVN